MQNKKAKEINAKMPKNDKSVINVKDRVDVNICDLSLSELNEVPVREIDSFKRVTILDLSSNRLSTLGDNFCILTRLVKLDLSKNQIEYLPDDFGQLVNLRHLDLYDNKLEFLPLNFGHLTNLRYLDLKGNPLAPSLAQRVGYCLTTKDCQDSARNTVKFFARMLIEAEKEMESQRQKLHPVASNAVSEEKQNSNQKSKKPKKKSKPKAKQNKNANEVAASELNSSSTKNNHENQNNNTKTNKTTKRNGNGSASKKIKSGSSAALASIFTFFVLLSINIVIIYMIMFKNPEIADKLVEFIPHQYRDWILTKTEIFRLHVTDWISDWSTAPEEQ